VPVELTGRPFTTAQAAALGVSKHALQSAPWRRIFRDVWAHRDLADDRLTRLAAARLVLPPHAVLCGLTAAWVHGVDVRRADDLDVHVGFPKGRRLRPRDGLVVCQETLDPTDWSEIDGVRVTTPVRTTFDCMRWLRGAEPLVVADAMTHAGLVDLDELRRYFAGKRRLRNLRVAELLLDEVEPLTESPMETRLRVLLVRGGLRRPTAQHNVLGADGRFIGRADLAYPERRLAIEYDGAWHWKQRRDDERRRTGMRIAGWEVLVFDADDVYGDPDGVIRTVRAALRSRPLAG
jgi:very-short-patch-repair endonuclease